MPLKVQKRWIIRYYCLHDYGNPSIHAKLGRRYHEAALCLRAVEKWAARFRGGQETVKDDSKPGRPPKSDLGGAVLLYLDKQSHSSSREISKAL
jgi:hypothetical protein